MPGVTYWQFPDEETAFLNFLHTTGTVVAIPSHPVDGEDELRPQPLMEFIIRHDPDQVLVGLEEHAVQRVLEPIVLWGKPQLCVASASSCLVSYRRGKFRDTSKLGQFNLSASWRCLNETQTALLDKDPGFKKWAEKVIRWVRKSTPEWHQYRGYRVTRRVKEAIERGELGIVP
jgi:hypothetical protein